MIARMRRVLVGFVFVAYVGGASIARAQAVLVDRVAAIVDGRPILRSAVLTRARLPLAKARTDVERQQLERDARAQLIDDRLIAKDAATLRIEVTTEEVDRALVAIARSNQLAPPQLAAEVEKQGYTMTAYRELLRQQLEAMRWLQARKGDADLDAERTRLLVTLRAQATIELLP